MPGTREKVIRSGIDFGGLGGKGMSAVHGGMGDEGIRKKQKEST